MVHLEESVQTLKFAQRAKKIMNKTLANVQRSPKEMEELIKKLKIEVQTLKGQLLELGVAPRAPDKNSKLALEAPPEKALPPASTASTATTAETAKPVAATDAAENDGLFDHLPKNEEESKEPKRESVVLTKKERAEL